MALALPEFVVDDSQPSDGRLALPAVVVDNTQPSDGRLSLAPFQFTEQIPSTLTHTPTGGVVVAGAADIVSDPWFPEGGVALSGEAVDESFSVLRLEFYPYGGVILGGAATVASAWTTFVPTGGVSLGGVAMVSDYYSTHIPSGGIAIGGAADVQQTPTGGVLIGGAATIVVLYPLEHTPTGGVTIGGAAAVASANIVVPAGGITIGGAATVGDYYPVFVPTGGVVIGGAAVAFALPAGAVSTTENPYNDPFPGWAINLETGAPSRYESLPANSMCQFRGRTYVANAGGIYEVAGRTDAGQPIRAAVTLPQSDFEDSREKRVPLAYVGARASGALVLKVVSGTDAVRYYALDATSDRVRGYRAKIGKGLKSRYWQFRLENKAGAYFEVDSMEFAPTVLRQRGA